MRARMMDWFDGILPPVLVKEVRQGLNRSGFLIQFYMLHVVLGLITIGQMAYEKGNSHRGIMELFESREVFWTLFALYLILVVPLSCINALSDEEGGRTLELMQVTGMRARRIVWGKFSYQLLFIAMIGVSTLPYVVSYHLTQGSDLAVELQMLGIAVGLSSLISGLVVGFSAFGSNRIKPLLFIVALFFIFIILVSAGSTRHITGGRIPLVHFVWVFGSFFLLVLLYAMELGAMRIGSTIDKRVVVTRILGLLLLVVPASFAAAGVLVEVNRVLMSIAVVLLPWHAMLTSPSRLPGTYLPFAQRGFLVSRLGRLLLYPGWYTGTIYCVLLAMTYVFVCLPLSGARHDMQEAGYVVCALIGIPMQFRLFAQWLPSKDGKTPVAKVVVVNLLLVLLGFGFGAYGGFTGSYPLSYLSFLPSNALLSVFFDLTRKGSFSLMALLAYGGQLGIVISLLLSGRGIWKDYVRLEARARENARMSS